MKVTGLWALLGIALTLGACEKKAPVRPAQSASAPTVIVVPPAAATPPKTRPRLAPAGIVYLTKRISVKTDTSVVGVPEGTKVMVISRDSGRITGHIDGLVVDVDEADTTNDIDRASEILTRRAKAEAMAAQADPLKAAGIVLPEEKPPTPQERKIARVKAQQKIQELETKIEDAKKELAEMGAQRIEMFRRRQSPNATTDTKVQDLKDSIEGWQKEITEARAEGGLGGG